MNDTPTDRPEGLPTSRGLLAGLPNWLCYFRLTGSIALVALAAGGYWQLAWSLLVVLLLSDWIDGPLARHFHGESRYGALLDSIADAVMYGAIVIVAVWYAPATLRACLPWIAAGAGSYAAHVVVCGVKFRRLPSYHTRLAKSGWLFVLLALVGLVTGGAEWLIPLAATFIIVTNLEGVLITLWLPKYRDNVPSILHILN